MTSRWRLTWLSIVAFVALLAIYWWTYAHAPAFNQRWLRGEDKLIEWFTFAGFLGACACMLLVLRNRTSMSRWAWVYFAGLGFLFFVCAGEEISWGQRLIGFETPADVKQVNEQDEFNLHNLDFKNFSPLGLVSLFMKVFGIAAPLIAWSRWPRYVPAVSVVPAFVFAELLSVAQKMSKPWVLERFGEDMATVVWRDTTEFKEMAWGVSCLLAAMALRHAWKRSSS